LFIQRLENCQYAFNKTYAHILADYKTLIATMSSAKMSQDAKKEEFKKYLEKAGVLELLTKSLVSLYEEPEKPNDAVNYLKKSVGGTDNDKVEIDKLQAENTDLKSKIAALEESQAKLQAKLAELEKEKAGSSGTEEDKPAPMEEAEDTPAVAAAPAPAETAPEPEPTKETEAPVVESTTEETKAAEASADEPMEAETSAEPAPAETSEAPAATETPVGEAGDAPPAAAPQ